MSDTKLIRIEKHHFHHHRRPPRTVYVPQVRTERVTEPCDRSHIGPGTAVLIGIGALVLLGALLSSQD